MQHLANFRPEYRMKWSLIKPAEYGRSHKFIQSMYAHVYSFRHFVRNEPLVCTTSKYMMDLPNPVERELLLGIIRMLSEVCLPLCVCVCLSVCASFVYFCRSNLSLPIYWKNYSLLVLILHATRSTACYLGTRSRTRIPHSIRTYVCMVPTKHSQQHIFIKKRLEKTGLTYI